MEITPMSQRDPHWADRPLGDGTVTIGQAGCLITCTAMAAQACGVDITPAELNAVLRFGEGYVWGNLMRWYIVAELLGIKLDIIEDCSLEPAPLDRMRPYLEAGWPIIIRVDSWRGLVDEANLHWVLWINDRQYIDPYNGAIKWMREPARNILKWAVYKPRSERLPKE